MAAPPTADRSARTPASPSGSWASRLLGSGSGSISASGAPPALQPAPPTRARGPSPTTLEARRAWASTHVAPLAADFFAAPAVAILRGVSGAGKSSLVGALSAEASARRVAPPLVCSADAFFMRRDGTYAFDVKLLPDAHRSCREHFASALRARTPWILVDNTNTARWQ
jgi:hypothetical protein